MPENITLSTSDKSAMALVRYVRDREGVVYSDYIKSHRVNAANLSAHVTALATLAFPGVKPSSRAEKGSVEYQAHSFKTAVRSGLKRHAGIESTSTDTDWIKLVRQAAENASNKGGKSTDEIMAAVVDALGGSVEFGEGDDGFPIALATVDAA